MNNSDDSTVNGTQGELSHILIIENKPKTLQAFQAFFARAFPAAELTICNPDSEELPSFEKLHGINLIFAALDSSPAKLSDWIKLFLDFGEFIPVVIIDSVCDADEVVEFMRLGVADFLCKKKIDGNRLREAIKAAAEFTPQKNPEGEKTENFTFSYEAFEKDTEEDLAHMAGDQSSHTGVIKVDVVAKQVAEYEAAELENAQQAEEPELKDQPEPKSFSAHHFEDLPSTTGFMRQGATSGVFTAFSDLGSLEQNLPFTLEDIRNKEARINYYQVIDLLGIGGSSAVFKVLRERDGDVSAMKVINTNKDTPESTKQRFIREFEMSQKLNKDHIVDIYAQGFEGDLSYSVMEYLPGLDLKTKIQNRLSREKTIDYAKQIASALHELHTHDIIHRDLKPTNIMFRSNQQLVLVDFGIAKRLNNTEVSLTGEGEVVGTPSYVSPEQALGGQIDSRSDLYSLGVMIFEMIERRRPFEGATAVEVMTAHVKKPVPMLSQEWDELNDVIALLMAKEPSDRYQTAKEVVEALEVLQDASRV